MVSCIVALAASVVLPVAEVAEVADGAHKVRRGDVVTAAK